MEKAYKYGKWVLIFPIDDLYPYPNGIVDGFRKFCAANKFDYSIIDEFDTDRDFSQKGEAFTVMEESDLVNLVKRVRNLGWKIGEDVGIISYNDTPLKKVLADCITVVSTDFKAMGQTARKMIVGKKIGKVENPFSLIKRKSL